MFRRANSWWNNTKQFRCSACVWGSKESIKVSKQFTEGKELCCTKQ